MNYKQVVKIVLIGLGIAGGLHLSCKPAAYEIVKPENKNVNENGDSNRFGPNTPRDQQPSGTPTNPGDKKVLDENALPTAAVEVIWAGSSVTAVPVSQAVTIRPSASTVDPDDIGVSQCVNPGIVKAAYDLDNSVTKSAERNIGCEALSIPHVFEKTGLYEIELTVTSNENETAKATMTLTVYDPNQPIEKGFAITAAPMLATPNQTITFTGLCTTPSKDRITWDFGDENSAEGDKVVHRYDRVGQYFVPARCFDHDGTSMTASVTVVVVKTSVDIPGHPQEPKDPSDPENPTGHPPGGGPGDPGNPGQGEPGQQKPGQN